MRKFINWLHRIWHGPEPNNKYWLVLDRMDDKKYVMHVWDGGRMDEKATQKKLTVEN